MKREVRISFSSLVKYGLQGVALGLVAMTAVIFFTLEPGALQLLRQFPIFFFPVFLCMAVCAWMCHGARIWALSNALGHKLKYLRCLSIALSVEFGVAASPAGVGGAAVRVAFLKQSGIPYTRAASMLAADVMLDVLYFCVLIMATFAVVIADPVWRGIFAGMHTTAPGRVGIITLVCALTAVLLFILSAR
ncbi:MAG: lysylphosphatidylglycerol synthase domain-containing protein, partial [Verrucomicrobiota bacterium]